MTITMPAFTAGSVSCARRRDREHRVYLAAAVAAAAEEMGVIRAYKQHRPFFFQFFQSASYRAANKVPDDGS